MICSEVSRVSVIYAIVGLNHCLMLIFLNSFCVDCKWCFCKYARAVYIYEIFIFTPFYYSTVDQVLCDMFLHTLLCSSMLHTCKSMQLLIVVDIRVKVYIGTFLN